jgi:hypothetical protein
MSIFKKSMLAAALLSAAASAGIAGQSHTMGLFSGGYVQEKLVSNDINKIPADHQDASLINP